MPRQSKQSKAKAKSKSTASLGFEAKLWLTADKLRNNGAFTRVQVVSASAPLTPSDPDDEIFLLCALDGSAHYLVSDDNALLALKPCYSNPTIGSSVDLVHLLQA